MIREEVAVVGVVLLGEFQVVGTLRGMQGGCLRVERRGALGGGLGGWDGGLWEWGCWLGFEREVSCWVWVFDRLFGGFWYCSCSNAKGHEIMIIRAKG